MLTNATIFATIPTRDLKKAKAFYVNKLGLRQVADPSTHGYMLAAADGSKLFIYEGDTRPDNDLVVAAFFVKGIEQVAQSLRNKGVKFEPMISGMPTDENGVIGNDREKAACFRDPDGNLLSLSELL